MLETVHLFSAEKLQQRISLFESNDDIPNKPIAYVVSFPSMIDEQTRAKVKGVLMQGRAIKTFICICDFTLKNIKESGIPDDIVQTIWANAYNDKKARERDAFIKGIDRDVEELFAEFEKELAKGSGDDQEEDTSPGM